MEQYFLLDFWMPIITRLIRVILILIGAGIGFRVFRLLIRRFFFGRAADHFAFEEKRAKTLSGLLESICRFAMYFVATVMVLQEFHVDTTSIIASAGVIGLAIGVGAQNIVKDFIGGFFIILENQYAVGEYVVSGPVEGTVEEIGFRVTKLRDGNGILHILPNGGITRVSNFNRGSVQTAVNVPVSYQADVQQVIGVLQDICVEFKEEHPELVGGPDILGIAEFQTEYMTVRILTKCIPMTQAMVEASLRYKIRLTFQERKIPAQWLVVGPEVIKAAVPAIYPEVTPPAPPQVEIKPARE